MQDACADLVTLSAANEIDLGNSRLLLPRAYAISVWEFPMNGP